MATNDADPAPRAVIHKRILEAAERRPDASLEALAANLPGASPELVERVLEEYGDPGQEAEPPEPVPEPADTGDPGQTDDGADSSGDSGAHVPATETTDESARHGTAATDEPDERDTMTERTPPTAAALTGKQREALRAIAEHPDATQAELAEYLGVSRATVNKRVNGIEGFEWRDRQTFVEQVLGDADDGDAATKTAAASDQAAGPDSPPTVDAASDGGLLDPADVQAIEQLQERVARLEQRADRGSDAPIEDAGLLAKVLRAVLADEAIDEAEELRVIEALL